MVCLINIQASKFTDLGFKSKQDALRFMSNKGIKGCQFKTEEELLEHLGTYTIKQRPEYCSGQDDPIAMLKYYANIIKAKYQDDFIYVIEQGASRELIDYLVWRLLRSRTTTLEYKIGMSIKSELNP